jgi:HEAT repeat protein
MAASAFATLPMHAETIGDEPTSRLAWDELLAGRDDGERAANLVTLLQRRGESTVADWGLAALRADDPWHRRAGAWVLRELGYPTGQPFADRVLPALVSAARDERDDDVRSWLVTAIGRHHSRDGRQALLTFAADPWADVRQAVAAALPITGDDANAEEVAALITLSRDVDPRVRDWATFGLGSQISDDSEDIRAALRARLADWEVDAVEETEIALEAVVGLAYRRDPAAFDHIDRLLRDPDIGNLVVRAAGELGDPRLRERLLELRAQRGADAVLDEAITALDTLR